MPSEKFKISKASRSIRHAAQNFFGTFSASPNGSQSKSVSYPIVGGNITASIHEDPETHLDRRSAHNALERQRRETLNSKFQELAHALPALQTVRRPSKTMIVAKSLDYVTKSIQRENNYVNQIKDLRKQNERLRKQAKASKAIMTKQTLSKKKPSSSTATTASSASSQPQPMTPPLSTSSSMQRTVSTAQTTTSTNSIVSSRQQQMSPPLTPETPNKQHHHHHLDSLSIKSSSPSPLIDANWPSSMMMMALPTTNASMSSHGMVSSSTINTQSTGMMMMPQWSDDAASDMMLMQQQPPANNHFYTAPAYHQEPTMFYHANQQPIINDPAAATSYLNCPDTINPMLFSPYQWQDTPPVYHPPKAQQLYLA
ncbi:hypothetical protein [Absidia glauca]|uniref:BHLH domain-containing protein n=1 Tax=Absidia glauca TaxID=4829 RepID=A0A168KW81_ABSGL|nr:hypothetical protein [Absidia glauca]